MIVFSASCKNAMYPNNLHPHMFFLRYSAYSSQKQHWQEELNITFFVTFSLVMGDTIKYFFFKITVSGRGTHTVLLRIWKYTRYSTQSDDLLEFPHAPPHCKIYMYTYVHVNYNNKVFYLPLRALLLQLQMFDLFFLDGYGIIGACLLLI